MKEYQQRVVAESVDLGEKIKRLADFIDSSSDGYRQIPLMEKERLHLQRYLMSKYNDVLRDRIEYFNEI